MLMQVVNMVSSMGLAWQPAFGLITLLYFYSHYFFASGALLGCGDGTCLDLFSVWQTPQVLQL